MRRLNNRVLIFAAIAALVAAAPAFAQTQYENTGTVIRADVRLVVLHTTVVDKNGHLVTNLGQKAFTVNENGVRQEIRKFIREDVPVSLGLIIDNSGSMRPRRAQVEAAALALVKDSNPDDEVFVVNFNEDAYLDNPNGKDFTNNIKEMEEALKRIDSSGGTAMRDAIRMSIDHIKKGHKDKKVLVVVTDGDDKDSVISLDQLVKAAQQSEVIIYSIGLLEEEEKREARRAKKALEALAEATGGETYFPKELSEVDPIAHTVARNIRSQYTIQYTPSNPAMDGSYRQIKVSVTGPNRPVARTRSGYYATPEQGAPPATGSSLKK